MKIVFIRHGHPNYELDCLTELGHKQAEAAGERLKDEHFDLMFASSCGRAYETACHVAERHGLEVMKLDFMRELDWGKQGTEDYAHPWMLADKWIDEGAPLMDPKWFDSPDYKGRTFLDSYNAACSGFDKWLEQFGLKREGDYYRITEKCDKTVLLASHAGSSGAILAHLTNIPYPVMIRSMSPTYTAITEAEFPGEVGALTTPRFALMNDANHIKGITVNNVFGR